MPLLLPVQLDEDSHTYVEPDISVICDPNKLDERGCKGAPDWIIEIVSPASRRMDYYTKLFRYRTAGVREYWIVDPSKNQIIVYDFEHGDMEQFTFQDSIKAGIYEDLFYQMMLGSKGLLTPLIPDCDVLCTLAILKNIRNPLIFL